MEFSPPRRKRNGAAFFRRHEGIAPYKVRGRLREAGSNARPYEFDRGSGDERRGDHWPSDNLSGSARPPPLQTLRRKKNPPGETGGKGGSLILFM